MEVKIGIADIPRELTVRTASKAEEIIASLNQAVTDGGLFEITDEKGRQVIVPAARIAYLDLGASDERPVGFGAV